MSTLVQCRTNIRSLRETTEVLLQVYGSEPGLEEKLEEWGTRKYGRRGGPTGENEDVHCVVCVGRGVKTEAVREEVVGGGTLRKRKGLRGKGKG